MKTKTALLGASLALICCSQVFGAGSHPLPIAVEILSDWPPPKLHHALEDLFAGELRRLGNVAAVGVKERHAVSVYVVIVPLGIATPGTDPAGYAIASSLASSVFLEYALLQENALSAEQRQRLNPLVRADEGLLKTYLRTCGPSAASLAAVIHDAVAEFKPSIENQRRYWEALEKLSAAEP